MAYVHEWANEKWNGGDFIEAWVKKLSEELITLRKSEGTFSTDQAKETDEGLEEALENLVFNHLGLKGQPLIFKMALVEKIKERLSGMGVLQHLLEDDAISEIMINGWKKIFIERLGVMEQLESGFESKEKLENIIQKMASDVNKFVNKSHPIADLRLKGGERVNVVLDPVSLDGPTVTIRKFSKKLITLDDMVLQGNMNSEIRHFLEALVYQRCNCFIAGGTSSGKTTLLNALSVCIPITERLVTIEDSAEIQIPTALNLIRLETRQKNFEGYGQIDMSDLIITALRMRPDRIIVGEVRGVEALSMLQAMNTGHDGSMSTGHANTNLDMLYRLETMILSMRAMPVEAIRRQIASGIDVMIYIKKCRDGKRRIEQIQQLKQYGEGGYELISLFELKCEEDCYEWVETEAAGRFFQIEV